MFLLIIKTQFIIFLVLLRNWCQTLYKTAVTNVYLKCLFCNAYLAKTGKQCAPQGARFKERADLLGESTGVSECK